jgi:hypothetical protein
MKVGDLVVCTWKRLKGELGIIIEIRKLVGGRHWVIAFPQLGESHVLTRKGFEAASEGR